MRDAATEKKRLEKSSEIRQGMKAIKASLATIPYWLGLAYLLRFIDNVPGLVVWALLMIFPPMAFYFYVVILRRDYPFRKGMRYLEEEKFRRAEREFREALANLHLGAAKMLGDMYIEGKRGKPDPDRAVWVYGEAFRHLKFIRETLPAYATGSVTEKYLSGKYTREQTEAQAAAWFAEIEPRLESLAAAGNAGAAKLLEEIRAAGETPP